MNITWRFSLNTSNRTSSYGTLKTNLIVSCPPPHDGESTPNSCDDESSLPVAGQQRTGRNCRLSTNSANRKRVHFTWTIPILRSEFRADLRRNRRVPRQGEVALVEGHVLSSKAKPNHCFGILRTLTSQRILTSPNHKRKKSSGKRDRKQKKTAIKF